MSNFKRKPQKFYLAINYCIGQNLRKNLKKIERKKQEKKTKHRIPISDLEFLIVTIDSFKIDSVDFRLKKRGLGRVQKVSVKNRAFVKIFVKLAGWKRVELVNTTIQANLGLGV